FLFDTKTGYCDYFASSMVVMLRTLGIPARLAAGYATGDYNQERGVWEVRESSSHSWPEVFFPRYGWIEFEPTPSQEVLQRPDGGDDAAAAGGTDDPAFTGVGGDSNYDDLYFDDMFERDLDSGYYAYSSYDPGADLRRNAVFALIGLLLAYVVGAYLWR